MKLLTGRRHSCACAIAFVLLTLSLSASAQVAPAPSSEAALAVAHVTGLADESGRPLKSSEAQPRAKVLMLGKLPSLMNAGYVGFLSGWQQRPLQDGVLAERTGGSMGNRTVSNRRGIEGRFYPHATLSSLPKYAFFSADGSLNVEYSLNYGRVLYEFRDSVLPRTSFTFGDSADSLRLPMPSQVIPREGDPGFGEKIPYVEAQVWGDLWLSDVKNVYVEEEVFRANSKMLLETAERTGFGIVLIEWLGTGIRADLKILRTERQADPVPHFKARPARELKAFLETIPAKTKAKWMEVAGSMLIHLPAAERNEILREIPELASPFRQAALARIENLRSHLIDTQDTKLARLEALRQWARLGLRPDFALAEPILQLVRDEKVRAYARDAGFDLSRFEKISAADAPVMKTAPLSEYVARWTAGFRLHPDEIAILSRENDKTPRAEWIEILSSVNPRAIYAEAAIKASFAGGRLMQKLIQSLIEIPPSEAEAGRLNAAIAANRGTQAAVIYAILLSDARPSESARAQMREAFRSYAAQEPNLGDSPVSRWSVQSLIGKFFSVYEGPDALNYALARAYDGFLRASGGEIDDLARMLQETEATLKRLRPQPTSAPVCARVFVP